MQHQGRLPERWFIFVIPSVLDNLEPQSSLFLESVMKEWNCAARPPKLQFLVRIAGSPPGGKLECGSEQHELFYLRMPGRIKGRQISSQAGAHQHYRLAANRPFDHRQLSG